MMPQVYTGNTDENQFFDTRKEAADSLQSYTFRNGGTCRYADEQLQKAYVDGAEVSLSENENTGVLKYLR